MDLGALFAARLAAGLGWEVGPARELLMAAVAEAGRSPTSLSFDDWAAVLEGPLATRLAALATPEAASAGLQLLRLLIEKQSLLVLLAR